MKTYQLRYEWDPQGFFLKTPSGEYGPLYEGNNYPRDKERCSSLTHQVASCLEEEEEQPVRLRTVKMSPVIKRTGSFKLVQRIIGLYNGRFESKPIIFLYSLTVILCCRFMCFDRFSLQTPHFTNLPFLSATGYSHCNLSAIAS